MDMSKMDSAAFLAYCKSPSLVGTTIITNQHGKRAKVKTYDGQTDYPKPKPLSEVPVLWGSTKLQVGMTILFTPHPLSCWNFGNKGKSKQKACGPIRGQIYAIDNGTGFFSDGEPILGVNVIATGYLTSNGKLVEERVDYVRPKSQSYVMSQPVLLKDILKVY